MNPEITLQPHQKNGVARVLYGKNTLLAYCVGVWQDLHKWLLQQWKAKGLDFVKKYVCCAKPFNGTMGQRVFTTLYRSKYISCKKKDFEPLNRKSFVLVLLQGEFDAVIIGHTQFEKIPLSKQRQKQNIQQQLDDIENGIKELKAERGERFQIKQLRKHKKI